jgi:hypothetical protein
LHPLLPRNWVRGTSPLFYPPATTDANGAAQWLLVTPTAGKQAVNVHDDTAELYPFPSQTPIDVHPTVSSIVPPAVSPTGGEPIVVNGAGFAQPFPQPPFPPVLPKPRTTVSVGGVFMPYVVVAPDGMSLTFTSPGVPAGGYEALVVYVDGVPSFTQTLFSNSSPLPGAQGCSLGSAKPDGRAVGACLLLLLSLFWRRLGRGTPLVRSTARRVAARIAMSQIALALVGCNGNVAGAGASATTGPDGATTATVPMSGVTGPAGTGQTTSTLAGSGSTTTSSATTSGGPCQTCREALVDGGPPPCPMTTANDVYLALFGCVCKSSSGCANCADNFCNHQPTSQACAQCMLGCGPDYNLCINH